MGAVAGMCAGAIMLFLSHIAPAFGAGNFIQDLDRPQFFGRDISRREAHLLGILVHLCMSLLFGLGYAILVNFNVVSGFEIIPALVYGGIAALFTGLVVMPIEGHGIFGNKHDDWFIADVVLTNLLWAVLFIGLVRLWMVV